ncbi:unnamed protein product [Alopecurus aequalis]
MEKAARRRHQVPAFGEWNYYYHYDEPEAVMAVAPPAVAYCYANATPDPEACSDVWFRYSPPPRKPATPTKKKTRRPVEGDEASMEKKGRRGARPASEAGGCGARAHRVVRPVDEDLYQVPPPELASRRRPRRRSLWMGCLGCVA